MSQTTELQNKEKPQIPISGSLQSEHDRHDINSEKSTTDTHKEHLPLVTLHDQIHDQGGAKSKSQQVATRIVESLESVKCIYDLHDRKRRILKRSRPKVQVSLLDTHGAVVDGGRPALQSGPASDEQACEGPLVLPGSDIPDREAVGGFGAEGDEPTLPRHKQCMSTFRPGLSVYADDLHDRVDAEGRGVEDEPELLSTGEHCQCRSALMCSSVDPDDSLVHATDRKSCLTH